MKILFADSFPDSHRLQLEQAGHNCTVDPALNDDTLPDAIGDHDILIVRSTKVSADTIDAGSALKLVIRAGAGTNTIDKDHAAGKGVRVCNVPGANSVAVAELAMGLILSIDRHLPQSQSDLKTRLWNKKKYSKAQGLMGQTIGILGLGAIGMALAERASAFGMRVLVVAKDRRDPAISERIQTIGIEEVADQDALLGASDIVSLHMPANENTREMVNSDFLAKMKDGAMLINTSRGELVDETALLEAMDNRGIRAGLDVYQNEPASGEGEFSSALAQHPSVCGTHHIGASTQQAQTAVADGVIRVIESFENNDLIFCVNA
ncbi:MAG: NAD(P)-dependent oxidoreductase [Pseudomonadota bacterium]